MIAAVRKCGVCKTPGHNRRRCPTKTSKGKIVFNYIPLVSYIIDFIVTENSYKELYNLSKVSINFEKAVHFITRKVFEIDNENNSIFYNRNITFIQSFPQVRKLNISYPYRSLENKIGEFRHMSSFTQLTYLNISYNNKLPQNVLSYFKNNINLQHLKISHCPKINNESLDYLKYFPNLTYLNVRLCTITNLQFLKYCPNIETLKVDCSHISNNSFVHLKLCPVLKNLSLDNCVNMNDSGFTNICSLSLLEKFHIRDAPAITNNVTMHLKQLKHLIIEHCHRITDMIYLKNVPKLYREYGYMEVYDEHIKYTFNVGNHVECVEGDGEYCRVIIK